jgi:hypothetical protein
MSKAMNKKVERTIIDKERSLRTFVALNFDRESGSNDINDSDSQGEKRDGKRISVSEQIVIDDDDEELRINR